MDKDVALAVVELVNRLEVFVAQQQLLLGDLDVGVQPSAAMLRDYRRDLDSLAAHFPKLRASLMLGGHGLVQ